MNICVYGSSSSKIEKKYIDSAYNLGRAIVKNNHTVVYGGGAEGVMGAVARGAYEEKGKIIGIAPSFFKVDGSLFDKCTKFIYPDTMRERKKILEDMSDAFIIAPGGIGTYDEFFEILTLKQLSRHNKPIAIFNVEHYYDDIINMLENIAKKHFMTEKSLNLFKVFDDYKKIIEYIENYNEKPMKIGELKNIN